MTPRMDLYGVVGEDFTTPQLRDFLNAHPGQDVDLHISSPGGSFFAGVEMHNLVRAHGRVTAYNDALVASAATLPFLAARRRVALAGSSAMIHRASSASSGNASDLEKDAEVLRGLDETATKLYARATGQPESRVAEWMDEEFWMNAEQQVELGFATAGVPEMAIAASIAAYLDQLSRFTNVPAAVTAMAKENPIMSAPNPNPNPNPDPKPTPAAPAADVTSDILARCETAKLDLKTTREVIARAGGSLDRARDIIIDMVAERAGDQRVVPGNDDRADVNPIAQAAEAYLYHRMTSTPIPADSPAVRFQGRSLLDVGAQLIEANGGRVKSWFKDKLASQIMAPAMAAGGHSTSDFPTLVGSAGQRVLADAYQGARTPLATIARRRSAADFRKLTIARLGEMPELLVVPEGGEVKYGSRTEGKESFQLSTFARIFAITRQALINDDLGAFNDSAVAWGQAAANVEASQLVALITGGGVDMDDGKALFHADHNNVIDNPLSDGVAALTAARMVMRGQTGLDGKTLLNISPRYLVVGSDNETLGDQLVTTIQPATVDNVNAFVGKLQVLVEPRLATGEWFLFGEPGAAEVVSYAYLGDAAGPQLETREGWTVLGSEFRCVFDYGAGATGTRGAVYSDGAGSTS